MDAENAAIAAAQNVLNKSAVTRALGWHRTTKAARAWNLSHPWAEIAISEIYPWIAFARARGGAEERFLRHVWDAVRPHAEAAGFPVDFVENHGGIELAVNRGGIDRERAADLLLLAANYVASGGTAPAGCLPPVSPLAGRMIALSRAAREAGFSHDIESGFDVVLRGTPDAYVWRRMWTVDKDHAWEAYLDLAVRLSDGVILRGTVKTIDRRAWFVDGTGEREIEGPIDVAPLLATLASPPRVTR